MNVKRKEKERRDGGRKGGEKEEKKDREREHEVTTWINKWISQGPRECCLLNYLVTGYVSLTKRSWQVQCGHLLPRGLLGVLDLISLWSINSCQVPNAHGHLWPEQLPTWARATGPMCADSSQEASLLWCFPFHARSLLHHCPRAVLDAFTSCTWLLA